MKGIMGKWKDLTGRGEKSNTEGEEEREINNSKNVYPLVLYLRTKSHNQHNFIKKEGSYSGL